MNIFYINQYLCYDKPLYNGQFSTIYTGFKINDQQHKLVIKKIKKNINKHFIREELQIMKRIRHSHILTLQDSFYKKKKLYLVLPYCNGGNVLDYIQSTDHSYDKSYIKQILSGILYLYKQNVIHRDIKPQNILIHNHNIKICDFGLSKSMYLDSIKNSICGSPKYIAPELFTHKKYSRKSDIWSLGIILYEILHKTHPYPDIHPKDYYDFKYTSIDIPEDTTIYNLIEQMLIVKEIARLQWSDLLEYTLHFGTKPGIPALPITIHTTAPYSRPRSASICIHPSNRISPSDEYMNIPLYSNSAPVTLQLSNSLHEDYIDSKVNQQDLNIKPSSSSQDLNYHNIIGSTPDATKRSVFGYYYNKLFTST